MKEKCMALALRQPSSLACQTNGQFEYAAEKLWKGLGLTVYGICALLCCALRAVLSPGSLTLWQESPEEIAKGGK